MKFCGICGICKKEIDENDKYHEYLSQKLHDVCLVSRVKFYKVHHFPEAHKNEVRRRLKKFDIEI